MKNIIVGIISGSIGLVTGFIIKDILDKNLDKTKKIIDTSLEDEKIDELFGKITDPIQRSGIIKKYHEMIRDGYHAKSEDEVLIIYKKLQDLISDIEEIELNSEVGEDDDNFKNIFVESNMDEYLKTFHDTLSKFNSDMKMIKSDHEKYGELFNSAMKSIGIKVEDIEESIKLHPVKITVDEADRYKEVDDNGKYFSEENSKDICEGDISNKQENNMDVKLSKEEQSPIQSQEDVQIDDDAAVTEEEHVEYDIDDELFSSLIETFVNPLMEKYGDQYEDRLVKMIDILSRSTTDPSVFTEYSTKLSAIKTYQDGDKGKGKLNEVISNFFSMFLSESDRCDE